MVHGDGKVLPVGVVDWNRVNLVVASAKDFEACLVRSRCADDGTSFEVELVSGVITGFMPNILQQKEVRIIALGDDAQEHAPTKYSWLKFIALAESCLTLKWIVTIPESLES